MESIDKLRDYAKKHFNPMLFDTAEEITQMCDAIEEEVKERYMVKPLDLDGKPIYAGARMEVSRWPTSPVETFTVSAIGTDCVYSDQNRCYALHDIRRYRAYTVEDVLEELLREYDRDDSELTNGEIIERFAAKLRLADDGEE